MGSSALHNALRNLVTIRPWIRPRRIGATDKLLEWNQNPAWFADLELHDRDGYAQPSALGSALHQATGPTLRITQHCALGGLCSAEHNEP